MKPRIHLLPEFSSEGRPHGSAFIRLLRPYCYPTVAEQLTVSWSLSYAAEKVDAVIVDRLWRPDITPSKAEQLVKQVHKAKASLIYALDDDFLEIPIRPKIFEIRHRKSVEFLLRHADGLLVTTKVLKDRFYHLNPRIVVLPHALDERLLVNRAPLSPLNPFSSSRLMIGYMGTYTHSDDLAIVLPALREICSRYPGSVAFQLVGVSDDRHVEKQWEGLPIQRISPFLEEYEYTLFMPWFTGNVHWDIAISPLMDSPFNQCKSDIKFLDYAALGAAGIYTHVPAYSNSVQNMKTGLVVKNETSAWVEALNNLIDDQTLRLQIAQDAHETLYRERILAVSAPRWVDAIRQLLRKRSGGIRF